MSLFMKIAGMTGTVDPSSTLTLPPGQPVELNLRDSFPVDAFSLGVQRSVGLFAAGTAARESSATSLSDVSVFGVSSVVWPDIVARAHAGTSVTSVLVYATNPPVGGLATRWISMFWIFRSVFVTGFNMGNGGDARASNTVTFSPGAMVYAEFADPAAGQLGARRIFGWDYAANKAV